MVQVFANIIGEGVRVKNVVVQEYANIIVKGIHAIFVPLIAVISVKFVITWLGKNVLFPKKINMLKCVRIASIKHIPMRKKFPQDTSENSIIFTKS